MVTKNPFKTVKKPGIFDLRSYFPDTITLKTLYDSMYEGGTPEEKAEQEFRNQDNPMWMRSGKRKLRQVFLRHFGVDPFSPGFSWDKQVKVTHSGLLGPAKEITVGGLSMRDAMKRWTTEKKQQLRMGKMLLDGKWVPRTPENEVKRIQSLIGRRKPEADDGQYQYIAYDEAKKIFPAYDRTFLRYIRRHKGHVPGIPYKMIKELARQAAYAKVLSSFREEKYRGMTLQQYWDYLKKTDEDIAHGKLGEGDEVPPDPPPGPLLDRLLQKKRKYERDRLEYFRKHKGKIPEYEDRILKRKGLAPAPPPTVTLINKRVSPGEKGVFTHLHSPTSVDVPKDSVMYKVLLRAGWVVATGEDLRKMKGPVVGRGVAPIEGLLPPKMRLEIRDQARPLPELERERLITPELGRMLSEQTQTWWDALRWAKDSRFGAFFSQMARVRPQKNVYQHLKSWWDQHKAALNNPPKRGEWVGAHQLGPYGFGKWYAKEGFSSSERFTEELRTRILPARLKRLRDKLVMMGVDPAYLSKLKAQHSLKVAGTLPDERPKIDSSKWLNMSGSKRQELLAAWEKFTGIRKALQLADLHEKEANIPAYRRQLPRMGFNSLGIFSDINPGDYLRAAFYNRFMKMKVSTGKRKGQFRWVNTPIIRDFTGLWGTPRYFKPSDSPAGVGGETVIANSWGEALAQGLHNREGIMNWRIRAAAHENARRAEIRNPLDLLVALGQGTASALLNVGALASGMIEGAGKYIGHALGESELFGSGKKKKDIRWLSRLTPGNLLRLKHMRSHAPASKEWRRFAAGKWVIAAKTAEQQTAQMFEEYIRGKLDKDVITNAVGNMGDIVVALAHLPGIVLGPQFEEFLKTSPDWLTRYQKAIELGQGFGKQMGYGFGKFIHMLVSNPKETFQAVPIDSLIMWYPFLKAFRRTPRYLAQSEAARAAFDTVYNASSRLFRAVDNKLGGKMLPTIGKLERASSDLLYKSLRKMGPLGEWAKRAKAGLKTTFDELFLMREAQSRMFYFNLFENIGGEAGLREVARVIPGLARRAHPAEFIQFIESVKEGLPTALLRKFPDLARALDQGLAISEDLARLSGMELPKGRVARTAYFKQLTGEKFSGLLEIIRENITPALEAKKLHELGRQLADYLGPTTATMEYGSAAIKGKGQSMVFYPQWMAANWVRKLITDPNWKGLVSDKLNVNPAGLIAQLKKLRALISAGDIEGTSWLFGIDLSKAPLTNRTLGRLKLAFDWLGPQSGKRMAVIEGLAKRLKNKDTRARVVSGIDSLIADVDRFVAIDYRPLKNLGITPDQMQWRFFGRKEFIDLPISQRPGIFVPESFNKLMRAHFERGMAADVPMPALLEASLKDLSIHQMKKLLQEVNQRIQSKYSRLPKKQLEKMLIKVPQSASRAEVMTALLRIRDMIGKGMPEPLAAFVEKIYGMSGKRWVEIIEALKNKSAGVTTKFEEAFISNLNTHGPIYALQKLFGKKLYSGEVALKDLAKMPSVLRFIPSTEKGAQAIQLLREIAVQSLLKDKKGIRGILEPIKKELNNTALRIEGGRVRSFWELSSPAKGSLTSSAMINPEKMPKFIELMIGGKSPDVLPAAVYRHPDLVVSDLLANKEALIKLAGERGVSRQKFLYRYEDVMRRLRQYSKVPEAYRSAFGLTKGETIYVPNEVLTGVKYMKLATQELGPVVSFAKRNLTTRRFITFMNNLQSSIMLQATRVGRFVNPFKDASLVAALAAEQRYIKGAVRGEASALIRKMLESKKLKQSDLYVYRDIVGLKKFLEMGAFELEMGGLRGLSKYNPLQLLERAYSYTDKGFKFHDAVRGHRWMSRKWGLEKAGNTVRFELTPGTWVTVRKLKNLDQTRSGRSAIVGEILGQDGAVIRKVTGEQLSQQFARASATMADKAFVNYGQLSKALALMRSKGLNVLGIFAPFLTWAYKATYIPGVKSGIPQMMFKPYPSMTFSGKAARLSALADMQAASLRATLLLQMGRAELLSLPREDIMKIMEYIPGEMRPTMVQMMGDAELLGTKDLGWMSFLGPTQLFFGLVKNFGVDAIKNKKLMGGDNEFFENHWLGPKNKGSKKQQILYGLTGPEGIKAGYSTKNGELTEKGKEVKRLREYVLSQAAKPSGRKVYDISQVLLMTGGIAKDFITILEQSRKGDARNYKILPKLAKSAMGLFLGGTVESAVDVAIAAARPKSIFTSRSDDPIVADSESIVRFAIRRITGLGATYKRTDLITEKHLKRLRRAWSASLIGETKERGSIRWGINNGELEVKLLQKKIEKLEASIKTGSVKPGFMQSKRGKELVSELKKLTSQRAKKIDRIKFLSRKKAKIESIIKSEINLYKKRMLEMLELLKAAKRKKMGKQGKLPIVRRRGGNTTMIEKIYELGPIPLKKFIPPSPTSRMGSFAGKKAKKAKKTSKPKKK